MTTKKAARAEFEKEFHRRLGGKWDGGGLVPGGTAHIAGEIFEEMTTEIGDRRQIRSTSISEVKDPANMTAAFTMTLNVIVSAKIRQWQLLESILDQAVDQVMDACAREKIEACLRVGDVRITEAKEWIAAKPRKFHYGSDKVLCKTKWVPKNRITTDKDLVTCQNCRKDLGLDPHWHNAGVPDEETPQ